jgi:hypothetical protein
MVSKLVSLTPVRFQSVQFTLKDRPVRITLFSRRCKRRLGCTFFSFLLTLLKT